MVIIINSGSNESWGTMELDVVRFVENRTLRDIRDLVRWVIKPAINRSEVVEAITNIMIDYIAENDGKYGSEKVLKRAKRLLEQLEKYR